MSISTVGIIPKKVSSKEVVKFIKQNYDKMVYNSIKKDEYFNNTEVGFINFNYKRGQEIEERELFFIESENNRDYDFMPMGIDYTWIKLNTWGSSVEIIEDMVKHFGGGFIDKNDCDNIDFEVVH